MVKSLQKKKQNELTSCYEYLRDSILSLREAEKEFASKLKELRIYEIKNRSLESSEDNNDKIPLLAISIATARLSAIFSNIQEKFKCISDIYGY